MLTRDWSWEFEVPRDRLWPYLADTDWINRHAGLPRIEARYEPQAEGRSKRIAWFRKGPMLVEWEERPTQWCVPEFFAVERVYSSGPLRRFFNRTVLAEIAPARTSVAVRVELEAASPLLDRLLPLIAAQGHRGADRAFTLAARLACATDARLESAGTEQRRFAALSGIDRSVTAALAGYVAVADDRELARMQPYALADRWHLPRREVLRGFLAATRAELFNLQWSVMCPSCRGAGASLGSLNALTSGHHCDACNVPFDAIFDRSVEVTFSAQPLRRGAARPPLYCIANPGGSAHVHAQGILGAASSAVFEVDLERGNYQINRVGATIAPFSVSDETENDRLSIDIPPAGAPLQAAVRPGRVRVEARNRTAEPAILRVEKSAWPDTIATAAHVTALQEFRDLFSSEVLAAGVEVGIESVAVLFSDLIGSTALYARTGDAAAFRIVTDHFSIVREIVRGHDGALVKTIGDAVMAAFVDPLQALDAALELDGSVATLDRDAPLRLRVGFHAGPCIAMNANDRIDYFGSSVNLAARMQALAGAGEVVLTQQVASRPAIARRLREPDLAVSLESCRVRGFAEPIDVVRVTAH